MLASIVIPEITCCTVRVELSEGITAAGRGAGCRALLVAGFRGLSAIGIAGK